MKMNVWGTATTTRLRGRRFALGVLLFVTGIPAFLTRAPAVNAELGTAGVAAEAPDDPHPVPRTEPSPPSDYLAVAALHGSESARVGVALARICGDAQELVLGVCGLAPDRPYRLVIDGIPAASLTPSEHGVLNASMSSAPGSAEEALPERARPVTRVKRIELRDGGGAFVVSGELQVVTARALRCPPRAGGATAHARRAKATP